MGKPMNKDASGRGAARWGAVRKAAAAACALALACAQAAPALGAETIVRDGSSAETVLTGRVKEVEDVISVALPSNIKMTIQTDELGHLDEEATQDVSVAVENEERSTRAVRLVLYETEDDNLLLDEVVLKLNGQDIKQAVGGATGAISLTGFIQPGTTDTLTMSAAPIGLSQVIGQGTKNVRTIIKATVSS